MSTLRTQIGASAMADFEENTWTFEMQEGYEITAGKFAIIPEDKYKRLLTALRGIRNSMAAHPDCEQGSEFADMIGRVDESLAEIKQPIKNEK